MLLHAPVYCSYILTTSAPLSVNGWMRGIPRRRRNQKPEALMLQVSCLKWIPQISNLPVWKDSFLAFVGTCGVALCRSISEQRGFYRNGVRCTMFFIRTI